MMKKVQIRKYNKLDFSDIEDAIVVEKKYVLKINNKLIYQFTCIDGYLKEMAVGYLYCENMIANYNDVKAVEIDENNRCIQVALKENVTKEDSGFSKQIIQNISLEPIYEFFDEFVNRSEVHQITGAVHSMAIATQEKILFQLDDISRHTALDKLIGYGLVNNISLIDKMLLLTCRITESIARKIISTGVKIVLTKAAVSDLAIKLCEENNITLAGFIKNQSLNVYAHSYRIT